jgi:hypothetical protein
MNPVFNDKRQMYLLVGAYDAVISYTKDYWGIHPLVVQYRDFVASKTTSNDPDMSKGKRAYFTGPEKLIKSDDPFFDEQTQWVGFLHAVPVSEAWGELPWPWNVVKQNRADVVEAVKYGVKSHFRTLFAKEGFCPSKDSALFEMFCELLAQVWNEDLTPAEARQLFDAACAIRDLQKRKKAATASQRGVAA